MAKKSKPDKRPASPETTSPPRGEDDPAQIRTLTGLRLELNEVPLPIASVTTTALQYAERLVPHEQRRDPTDPASHRVETQLGFQLRLGPDGLGIRLRALSNGTNGLYEVTASAAVLVVHERPTGVTDEYLVEYARSLGINVALGFLRAEISAISRNGTLGPIYLDPVVLSIEPDEGDSSGEGSYS
jgi:hypothetical protein